jgi:homoserine kinase
MTARRRLVKVPASSANLGPGYDVLAAALAVHLELEVEEVGSFSVEAEGLGVPLDRSNLCVRAFESLRPADGIAFRIKSEIPLAAGLGSSAAAIVAGLLAADHLYELAQEPEDILAKAAEIEGHPDNVAACLLGGFTLAWTEDGAARAIRMDPADSIVPVVFVPGAPVLTETARGLLPRTVPHVDAAVNAGRAALLVHAVTKRPELLLAATEDRLHQDYRAPAMPESVALVNRLRTDGVPAVISGAGPTVLALVEDGAADKVARLAGEGWAANRLALDAGGASVLPLT